MLRHPKGSVDRCLLWGALLGKGLQAWGGGMGGKMPLISSMPPLTAIPDAASSLHCQYRGLRGLYGRDAVTLLLPFWLPRSSGKYHPCETWSPAMKKEAKHCRDHMSLWGQEGA